MSKKYDVPTLGKRTIKSPIQLSNGNTNDEFHYISDSDRVLIDGTLKNFTDCLKSGKEPASFEKSGPREFIYFEPAKTKVAIVSCGGLCPGLNNVIRGLVTQLFQRYNVQTVFGIKYGYEGLIPEHNHPYVELDPETVDDIHKDGGTILGSSRGAQDIGRMVDTLERLNINILFTIGGDGTLTGAHEIYKEITRRNLKISIGCVPKTIDNDINCIQKSFGFETAFATARDILINAHYEAKGALNGIALIKLMGRDSGFIAANAALAVPDVNYVLVPEMEFDLYGENGFFNHLQKRLARRKHAVIVVAEGAGQFLFSEDEEVEVDASGNVKHRDIGVFLLEKMKDYYAKQNFPVTIKYIDPSYIIRSTAANANDSKFCSQLAQNAVHAAMAGHTDFVVGYWNNFFTLMPISLAISERKKINLNSEFWWSVLEATGQPGDMRNVKQPIAL